MRGGAGSQGGVACIAIQRYRLYQGPGKVAVGTKCPNMPVAGIWLPAWTNAGAWCRATTWAHRTNEDESRLCRALAPIPLARPKPVTAVSRHPRNSTTQSQNDGSRLRARGRPGLPPALWCQAGNGEGPGYWTRPPATELDQTKLYGFVVNSWSDKVLSVQRIRTRTRTR